MRFNIRKRDWIIAIILVCVVVGFFVYLDRRQILDAVRASQKPILPPAVVYRTPTISTPTKTGMSKPVATRSPSPASTLAEQINLAVPFTPQAPTADWGDPYEDACEEASVLMVNAFYAGTSKESIPAADAQKEILDLVAFENTLLGFSKDTTAAQTAKFAEAFYGFGKSDLIENPTIEQIKTYLDKQQPVIVPAFGQALKNPYFVQPGPVYHMLVLRGYTKDGKFIVNDPGTKHGQAYIYSFETIMDAMHDWDAQDILHGKKVILVLHPKS